MSRLIAVLILAGVAFDAEAQPIEILSTLEPSAVLGQDCRGRRRRLVNIDNRDQATW